jgi:hypothetical protein
VKINNFHFPIIVVNDYSEVNKFDRNFINDGRIQVTTNSNECRVSAFAHIERYLGHFLLPLNKFAKLQANTISTICSHSVVVCPCNVY